MLSLLVTACSSHVLRTQLSRLVNHLAVVIIKSAHLFDHFLLLSNIFLWLLGKKTWDCSSKGTCTKTLRQHTDYVTCLATTGNHVIFLVLWFLFMHLIKFVSIKCENSFKNCTAPAIVG